MRGELTYEILYEKLSGNKKLKAENEKGKTGNIEMDDFIEVLYRESFFRIMLANEIKSAVNRKIFYETHKIFHNLLKKTGRTNVMIERTIPNTDSEPSSLLEKFIKPILQVEYHEITLNDIEVLQNYIELFAENKEIAEKDRNKDINVLIIQSQSSYNKLAFQKYDLSAEEIKKSFFETINFTYMLMKDFFDYYNQNGQYNKPAFYMTAIRDFICMKNNGENFLTNFITNELLNNSKINISDEDNDENIANKSEHIIDYIFNELQQAQKLNDGQVSNKIIIEECADECFESFISITEGELPRILDFYDYLSIILNVSRLLCKYIPNNNLNSSQEITIPCNNDLGALKVVWDNINNFSVDDRLKLEQSQSAHQNSNPGLILKNKYKNGKYICQDCNVTPPCSVSAKLVSHAKKEFVNEVQNMTRIFYSSDKKSTCSGVLIEILNKNAQYFQHYRKQILNSFREKLREYLEKIEVNPENWTGV